MKNTNIKNWIIALIAIILIFVLLKAAGLTNLTAGIDSDKNINLNQENVMNNKNTSQLLIEDIVTGQGAEAVAGKLVTVNYVGTLTDGTKFDSSIDRNTPFQFTLGAGQVIQGWELGISGMKVGGKRKLTIPAELGYGSRAIGPIPANSTLIFEVDLLGVK